MRTSALFLSLIFLAAVAHAQSDTTITYQGQLQDGAQPFDGTAGMEFRLFDSLEGGSQVGSAIVFSSVSVADGLFQVELDFGNVYGANPLYLEVMVDGQTLVPREFIASTPLAVHALSLDPAFAADRFWQIGGNAGTSPGSDFLGTTDAVAFELHVDSDRALRVVPLPSVLPIGVGHSGPNIIGGWIGNSVSASAVGATIGGGGGMVNGIDSPNLVSSPFGTISGGVDNTVSAWYAAVGGGRSNTASSQYAAVNGGLGNTVSSDYATVSGGRTNNSSGQYATVGGGWNNTAFNDYGTVGGGNGNGASSTYVTVGGGGGNVATGTYATIGGGDANTASGSRATIGGGENNTAGGHGATVPGGSLNEAAGDYSLAAGRRAKANHGGAFVWADSVVADFASTGTDQFLIRAGGGMGINTNSPDRDLHIKQRSTTNSEIGLQIERSDSTNNWAFYIATSDNLGFRYNDTLKSRINASDGAFVAISDVNAKHSIEPLSGVLDKVLQLKPRSYRMKDAAATQSRSTGLIAQDVEALFPDTVSVQDGLYGIKYSEITVLNTAALIELHDRYSNRIANLESESAERFATLESDNDELRARVAVLSVEARQMQKLADRNRALEDRLAALEALLLEDREVAGK